MSAITIKLEGHVPLRNKLRRVVSRTRPTVATVNRRYEKILLAEGRASASGRPGPEVETGAFRDAMETGTEYSGAFLMSDAVWLTNRSPQAARLEHGFVGVDSLGRHYAQPPYPWARPTFDRVAPRYAKDLGIAMEKLIDAS